MVKNEFEVLWVRATLCPTENPNKNNIRNIEIVHYHTFEYLKELTSNFEKMMA